MPEDIKYREFIEACCTVATVLGDRLWNATNAPVEIARPGIADAKALGARDAAKYVSFGRTKFLELVKSGEIPPAMRIAGQQRWMVKELDRYLAKQSKSRA